MGASHYLAGVHAVDSALTNDATHVALLLVVPGPHNPRLRKLMNKARDNTIEVREVSRAELVRLVKTPHHQGIGAAYETPRTLGEEALVTRVTDMIARDDAPLLLVLDTVQDPRNFGACLRCADAAGVDAVVIAKNRAAPITPAVRKTASGAAESVPIARVTNLARTLGKLAAAGVWLVGTSDSVERDCFSADLCGPLALIVGNEEKGMRRLTREACDLLVRIPMAGSVSSLNVSAAAAVLLFEARRQRCATR